MVSTCYAMREALALVNEEGLESMWSRHEELHHRLWDGLHSMGLKSFIEKDEVLHNDMAATNLLFECRDFQAQW
jgi:aspartate aminotransferase-like enzyme